MKIDSTSEADAREAVEELRSKHGIDHLDTVIANAGIGKYHGPLMGVTTAQLQEHINVNMFGTSLHFREPEAELRLPECRSTLLKCLRAML